MVVGEAALRLQRLSRTRQIAELHLGVLARDHEPLSASFKTCLGTGLDTRRNGVAIPIRHVGDIHIEARPNFSLRAFHIGNAAFCLVQHIAGVQTDVWEFFVWFVLRPVRLLLQRESGKFSKPGEFCGRIDFPVLTST